MPKTFTNQFEQVHRRGFLTTLATTAFCAAIGPANARKEIAKTPEVVRVGSAERPRTDIEAWNVGIITAARPGLTTTENAARNAELRHEIRLKGFGYLNIRGRYVENYGTARARTVEEHGFLIFGNADDNGNLKGFLRKYGRRFEQDAVVHKGYYRDAQLHALKAVPSVGITEQATKNLGVFQPNRIGEFYTLMTRSGASGRPTALINLVDEKLDWLGGRWESIGFWRGTSFFNRAECQIVFEN